MWLWAKLNSWRYGENWKAGIQKVLQFIKAYVIDAKRSSPENCIWRISIIWEMTPYQSVIGEFDYPINSILFYQSIKYFTASS